MTLIKDDFRLRLGHSTSACSWHRLELYSSFKMEILYNLSLQVSFSTTVKPESCYCLHTQNGFDPTLFFHQENQRLEFHSLHFNLATSRDPQLGTHQFFFSEKQEFGIQVIL